MAKDIKMNTPKQLFDKRYRQIKAEYEKQLHRASQLLSIRQESCKHNFHYYMGPAMMIVIMNVVIVV